MECVVELQQVLRRWQEDSHSQNDATIHARRQRMPSAAGDGHLQQEEVPRRLCRVVVVGLAELFQDLRHRLANYEAQNIDGSEERREGRNGHRASCTHAHTCVRTCVRVYVYACVRACE